MSLIYIHIVDNIPTFSLLFIYLMVLDCFWSVFLTSVQIFKQKVKVMKRKIFHWL